MGAALQPGGSPRSKTNVPGHIRGYDVRTGEKLWTFRTIPHPGEVGNDTWEDGSWEYTGNTSAWAPLAGDEELGYVYIPTEMPTGDVYGGHRLGEQPFRGQRCLSRRKDGRTSVALPDGAPRRLGLTILDLLQSWPDVTVDGRERKVVAQPSKQGFLYVFDRVTGEPIWPIEERPVEQTDVPGERLSPTQPFPTRPAPYAVQGATDDDLIDLTPDLKAEAIKIANQYKRGPLFTPANRSRYGRKNRHAGRPPTCKVRRTGPAGH